MISTLLLFGATGDLAARFLFPGLGELRRAGKLPTGFQVVAAAREDLDSEAFRMSTAEFMERDAVGTDTAARNAILNASHYRAADVEDAASVGEAVRHAAELSGGEPVAVYLALPPAMFGPTIASIGAGGLPPGSRVVLEKPFGTSLETARALNASVERELGQRAEEAVFLVDHVLGMPTVERLASLRLENPILDDVWSARHVGLVEILWEETLALENRAGFYDQTGALRDVVQNHALQILSVIAMASPAPLDDPLFRPRKLDAMATLRLLRPDDLPACARRARYTAGRLADGRAAPAYADEDGVDPSRETETFAEVALEAHSDRWIGTAFVLRAGKALDARRKKAVLHFRTPQELSIGGRSVAGVSELHIGIDGPEDVAVKTAGPGGQWLTVAERPSSALPPYARVLLDVFEGGRARSVGRDEAEEAWRLVTPVLDAWSRGEVPLEEYAAGSSGPKPRD